MASIVACPSCSRKLRVADELRDESVKCPTCGAVFRATDSVPPPLPPAEDPRPSHAENDPAPLVEDEPKETQPPAGPRKSKPKRRFSEDGSDEFKECPYCGEEVRAEASHCRHCRHPLLDEDDEDDRRPWERYSARRDCDPHRGSPILVMGILSLVAAPLGMLFFWCFPISGVLCLGSIGLGLPAWVMGHHDLNKIRAGQMDPRGHGRTQAGWVCGMIGTILSLLTMVAVAGFVAYMVQGGGPWFGTSPTQNRPGKF